MKKPILSPFEIKLNMHPDLRNSQPSYFDMLNESIDRMCKDLHKQKHDLISDRIFILTGERVDLNKEVLKLFPRIVATKDDDIERFYWNDGSKDGKLLITFYGNIGDNAIMDYEAMKFKMSYTLKYD